MKLYLGLVGEGKHDCILYLQILKKIVRLHNEIKFQNSALILYEHEDQNKFF